MTTNHNHKHPYSSISFINRVNLSRGNNKPNSQACNQINQSDLSRREKYTALTRFLNLTVIKPNKHTNKYTTNILETEQDYSKPLPTNHEN